MFDAMLDLWETIQDEEEYENIFAMDDVPEEIWVELGFDD